MLALAVSGCSDTSGDAALHGGARTYFESLDLSTPERAAETFLDAFARDDFMTVWLIFHQPTQSTIDTGLNHLQSSVIVDHTAIPRSEYEEVYAALPPASARGIFLFDALMLTAGAHDAFLIDLSGSVSILREVVDGDRAEVLVEAAGVEGVVTLHMARVPQEHWRVSFVERRVEGEPPVIWPRQPDS